MCQVNSTSLNQTSGEDYKQCVTNNSELAKPPLWTYWILSFCTLAGVLGGIILQCSSKVQQHSMESFSEVIIELRGLAGRMSTAMWLGRKNSVVVHDGVLGPTISEPMMTVDTTGLENLESSESIIVVGRAST